MATDVAVLVEDQATGRRGSDQSMIKELSVWPECRRRIQASPIPFLDDIPMIAQDHTSLCAADD